MKRIKLIAFALLLAAPASAGVHIMQGDAVTVSSVTITGAGIQFSNGSVQSVAAGGSSAAIAISSGSATNSVVISSPTTNIVVDSNTFIGALQGTTSSFLRLNPSSVTLQGVVTAGSLGALTGNQTITLSGDASGSGATSISVTNAPWQPNIKTFTSSTTFNGTVVISSGLVASGSAGTNGQVLTSGGAGTVPTWTSSSGSKAPISYIMDGGGIVISSAIASLQAFYEMPYSATISSYTLSCDTNTATVSISVSTQSASQFASLTTPTSICASACPSLSNARRFGDGTLSGWATSLGLGDYVIFDLATSPPTNAKRCILQVLLQ